MHFSTKSIPTAINPFPLPPLINLYFPPYIPNMVAEPDFKSGFETDSNPDLTKN